MWASSAATGSAQSIYDRLLCYLDLMNRRIFSAVLLASVFSATLVFAQSGAAPAPDAPAPLPGYLPDPTASSGELMEGAWVFQSRTVLIRMTPLTDETRSAYIREKTGSLLDPFGPRPDGSPRFISFLLEILNRSDGPLAFEPQKCWLLAPPGELKLPVDLARIQTGYSVHEQDMPEQFTVAGQALINGEQILPPGHKVSGLLVFSAPSKSPREFRIELQLMNSRGKTLEYKAAYATEKRLQKKMKKLLRQQEKGAS